MKRIKQWMNCKINYPNYVLSLYIGILLLFLLLALCSSCKSKKEPVIIENYKGNVVTEKMNNWSEFDQKSKYYFQIKIIVKDKQIGYEKISVTEYDYKKYNLGDTL